MTRILYLISSHRRRICSLTIYRRHLDDKIGHRERALLGEPVLLKDGRRGAVDGAVAAAPSVGRAEHNPRARALDLGDLKVLWGTGWL
jgi:hypothetical protein